MLCALSFNFERATLSARDGILAYFLCSGKVGTANPAHCSLRVVYDRQTADSGQSPHNSSSADLQPHTSVCPHFALLSVDTVAKHTAFMAFCVFYVFT